MRVTVCQLPDDLPALERSWAGLTEHTRSQASELVLLPELPFHPWLAATREVDADLWAESVAGHRRWSERLAELAVSWVVGTRPVVDGSGRFNEGFVWSRADDAEVAVHRKRYLPDEPGFWEASWYTQGPRKFVPYRAEGWSLGFAICTEIWFTEHARRYGQQGVQLLVCPRATLAPSVDKWLAGGRAAAVVSGAYCLSSNRSGRALGDAGGELGDWGGLGWIVEPEEGEVLGTTSEDAPFLTLDLDLAVADAAKTTYPRYVRD